MKAIEWKLMIWNYDGSWNEKGKKHNSIYLFERLTKRLDRNVQELMLAKEKKS